METPEAAVRAKLSAMGAPEVLTRTFLHHHRVVTSGEQGLLAEKAIRPVDHLPKLDGLPVREEAGREALAHTLVLKLNGGLGTSMGLDRAKSLLPVKDGLSFLDIIANQVLALRTHYGTATPLLLMNSAATQRDTHEVLAHFPEVATGQEGLPASFLQHRVPKLDASTLTPAAWPNDPACEWCPPGHGDLYTALQTSGALQQYLEAGYRYAFVSNADNLGATTDLAILGHLAAEDIPFLVEVTVRTAADRKGGHLARALDGQLLLREVAQCPPDELDSFQNIERYRFFNTNNLWMDLHAVDRLLRENDGIMDLPVMVNHKTVDPRDADSPAVLQLETAMGAALALFPKAAAVEVPRTRFAPVKTTDDLLALRSDAYELTPEWRVRLHAERRGQPPDIILDPAFYRRLPDFDARFPEGAPSLRACERLRVEGDIRFGRGVRLTGKVHLQATEGAQAHLADGAVVEGTDKPLRLS